MHAGFAGGQAGLESAPGAATIGVPGAITLTGNSKCKAVWGSPSVLNLTPLFCETGANRGSQAN